MKNRLNAQHARGPRVTLHDFQAGRTIPSPAVVERNRAQRLADEEAARLNPAPRLAYTSTTPTA